MIYHSVSLVTMQYKTNREPERHANPHETRTTPIADALALSHALSTGLHRLACAILQPDLAFGRGETREPGVPQRHAAPLTPSSPLAAGSWPPSSLLYCTIGHRVFFLSEGSDFHFKERLYCHSVSLMDFRDCGMVANEVGLCVTDMTRQCVCCDALTEL
jgi:hypothetical protein